MTSSPPLKNDLKDLENKIFNEQINNPDFDPIG